MDETTGFSIAMPLDKVAVGTLTDLLQTKESLIKKALDIKDVKISIEEDKVVFNWFDTVPSAEEIVAYTQFISAMCQLSTKQKRVNKSEKPIENEKYAFRCFLLRLGFIGDEYKESRKILLKNLSGSSAFKNVIKEDSIDEISK